MAKKCLSFFNTRTSAHFFSKKLAIEEVPAKQLTEKQRLSFVELLKDFQFTVYENIAFGKNLLSQAVDFLKEVTPKTMESKLVNGLFFCCVNF